MIEKNSLVTIRVQLFDLQGNLLEETSPDGVMYWHGHGDIFPGIEKALEGKAPGETVTVTLDPEDSFGEFDAEAITMVPVSALGEAETIVPGLVFDHVPGEAPDGRHWRVSEVAESMAILDANHPLAGWTLKFVVTVADVQKCEEDEPVSDETVVPAFLGFADSIIDEGDDAEDDAEEALLNERLSQSGSVL